LVVLVGLACSSVAHAEPRKHKSDPGGLGAQWWQLVTSLPTDVNPFLDETKCGVGQAGPTWFLYSTAPVSESIGDPTDATCTIPTHQRIFLSIIAAFCIPDPDQTIEDSAEDCAQGLDRPDVLHLEIDGVDRSRLIERRTSTRPFAMPVPEDNVYGLPSGIFTAVHDGYFALLPPLKPGDHTVLVQGAITLESGQTVAFSTRHLLRIIEPAATLPFVP
jgi:hypothetical protein